MPEVNINIKNNPTGLATLSTEKYDSLLQEVTAQGLFERTYLHYCLHGVISAVVMGISLYALTLTDSAIWQTLNAIVFASFSIQIGLICHDLSHGQVFKLAKANDFGAMMCWGLLCGLSESRWYYKHNIHHKNPNHIGHDPDLEILFVFSNYQAEKRSTFSKKWFFPNQHILFWIALSFVYPYNIASSMTYLFSNLTFRSTFEICLMIIHFIIIIGLPFYLLPFPVAVIFIFLVFLIRGVYMGTVFAPNHKGEDMLNKDEPFNWTYQITFTRNIRPNWLTFYLLGGLIFQIEHHLFPTMSRLKCWQARQVVMNFCEKHNLRYHETTWLGSMLEIHKSLKQESLNWRS